MAKKGDSSTICLNRRARFDYEILDTYEGGLVLQGTEVKSIRAGNISINEAYAAFTAHELWLINAHISPYENAGYSGHEERRSRKILLHKKELEKLRQARETKGLTLIPLRIYWKYGRAKIELGLAKGKKTVDKRETIKRREWDRQKNRVLKQSV